MVGGRVGGDILPWEVKLEPALKTYNDGQALFCTRLSILTSFDVSFTGGHSIAEYQVATVALSVRWARCESIGLLCLMDHPTDLVAASIRRENCSSGQ